MGGMHLRHKDSNAVVRVRDRATGKALEGADRQIDRQTDFLHIIVRCQQLGVLLYGSNDSHAQIIL